MRCHLTRDLEEAGTKGVFGNEDCDGKIFDAKVEVLTAYLVFGRKKWR